MRIVLFLAILLSSSTAYSQEEALDGLLDNIRQTDGTRNIGAEFFYVTSKNFTLVSPKEVSAKLLAVAEHARKKIAKEWLGQELPNGEPIRLLMCRQDTLF